MRVAPIAYSSSSRWSSLSTPPFWPCPGDSPPDMSRSARRGRQIPDAPHVQLVEPPQPVFHTAVLAMSWGLSPGHVSFGPWTCLVCPLDMSRGAEGREAEGVRGARAGVRDHRLRLEILVERLDAELAAESRLLVAAEGDAGERCVRHVDADRSRLHLLRDAVAARGIAGPDRRHQAVAHV